MRVAPLLFLFLSGSAMAAPVQPIEQLKPMSYLAGYCWKGSIPASVSTDEHCFEWILNGHALRDTHTVRTAGKPDYVGETTYYWSKISGKVEYLYLENDGGMSRGTMDTVAGMLVFPPAQSVPDEPNATYRMRWEPSGKNSYDAWSEKKLGEDWHTMFKMTMKKSRKLPARKAK